jgi:hypothetical protein
MQQSPSWKANSFSATQEIPRNLWNPEVHYRIYKSPPPVPILSQLHPVHAPLFHVLNILFDIILPPTPGSPKWSPSLRSPYQNPLRSCPLPHTCHMPRPSHSSQFDHLDYIWWWIQVRGFVRCFVTWNVLRWGVISTLPSPQAGRPPLLRCPRLLIQFIRSYPP